MTININKIQTDMLNRTQNTKHNTTENTTEAIEETNSVLYATGMTFSDFGFF